MSSIKRPVKCPSCKAVISAHISPEFAPFCSKRCKQNDLGDWASEKFRIAAEPAELAELAEPGRIDELLAKRLACEDAEH